MMTPYDPARKLADYEAEGGDFATPLHRILFVATRPVSKKDRIERIKEICRGALGDESA